MPGRSNLQIVSAFINFLSKRSNSSFIMSKTKTIVLTVVRHGQTDSNKERLMQGTVNIFPLYIYFHNFYSQPAFGRLRPKIINGGRWIYVPRNLASLRVKK